MLTISLLNILVTAENSILHYYNAVVLDIEKIFGTTKLVAASSANHTGKCFLFSYSAAIALA